jgi:DNA-binding CsgD family transcriptional regulator
MPPPDTFQKVALNRLKNVLPFDSAAWCSGWASGRKITERVVVNQSAGILDDWGEVAHLDKFCDLSIDKINHSWRFDDVKGYKSTLAYNEHWRHFDVDNMLVTINAEPLEGHISFVGLCGHQGSRPYTPREQQIKQCIMPHLSQSLRFNRQNYLQQAPLQEAALALVDKTGLVHASRGPLADMLRELGPKLGYVPQGVMQTLYQRGMCHSRGLQFGATAVGPLLLMRIEVRQGGAALTSREEQVARLFTQGLTYKQVARELDVAPATVRNQIANIYKKTQVNNKVSLHNYLDAKNL